jgi:hypothetical protein
MSWITILNVKKIIVIMNIDIAGNIEKYAIDIVAIVS